MGTTDKPTSTGQDVLILYGQTSRSVTATYLKSNGATFSFATNQYPIADFNGDGHNDFAVLVGNASNQQAIDLFLGGPNGTFTLQEIVFGQNTFEFGNLVVGDFNRDNKPDFLLAAKNDLVASDQLTRVYDYLNTTAGAGWSPCSYPASAAGISTCISQSGTNGGTVRFDAAATWFEPLRKLELWVDGNKVSEEHNVWDKYGWLDYANTYAVGTHRADFYSAGYDNALQHKQITFTVGGSTCSPPSSPGLNVCSPTDGSTVSSPVHTLASGTVTGTVLRMEVWVDGVKKFTVTHSNTLDTSVPLGKGKHRFDFYIVNTVNQKWEKTVYSTVQ